MSGEDLPLLLRGTQAAKYVGLGRDRFRKLVKAGVIPQWQNPLGGWPMYSRDVLDEWARKQGSAA